MLRQRFASAKVTAETVPRATTTPVVVFGMNDVALSVSDALEAHGVPYDALEGSYDRFLSASADGYPVAFGNLGDVRLMETLAYSEREAIVITDIHYDVAEALTPTMHERYPNLPCFIAADTDEDKIRIEKLGLRPVVDRSIPRGLDLAAEVLRYQRIDEEKIEGWMRRQQERTLQTTQTGQRGIDFHRLRASHT